MIVTSESARLPVVSQLRERVEARLSRKRNYRVILRKCITPEAGRVEAIISECAKDLGVRPSGKVLLKPCVVTANRRYIRHSYTDPEISAAAIRFAQKNGATDITLGESGGYGIPSRFFFRESGYLKLKSLGVRVVDFSTEPTIHFPLQRAMHHTTLALARSLAEADTLIWLPKLKYHVCCTITCALKLNVGITTHKERMLFHDDRLDEKIVDLLEFGYPDLVVVDAIEVGHGYESAPWNLHLGVILAADDPVAADVVACQLLGYDPQECRHLMLALEHGYGPSDLCSIKVEGDISIEEIQQTTGGFESKFQDLQKLKTPILFICGVDPARYRTCHGGCQAAVKGCLGTVEKRRPGSLAKARFGAVITGTYNGDVDVGNGIAVLVGNCTRVIGSLKAGKIRRIKGCPLGTKHLLFWLPIYFGLPTPWLSLRDAFLFLYFSADKVIRTFVLHMKVRLKTS